MERLWNWHQDGKELNNIDEFIKELKKANAQKDMLLQNQMLKEGDVLKSANMLLAFAIGNPKSTDKVVNAAVEMNRYLNFYYKNALNSEKLAIPAMLEALEPNIQKNASEHSKATTKRLVDKAKEAIHQDQDKDRRDIYDGYLSGYKNVMNGYHKEIHKPLSNQKVISI